MRGIDHQRCKGFTPPHIAAGGERSECIAVIALQAGNYLVTFWLTYFKIVLPCEFDCRFHRLGTTRYQKYPVEIAGRVLNQQVSHRLGGIAIKKSGMRKLHAVELCLDRIDNFHIAMPETGDCRAAGTIEVLLALLVDQINAFAFDRDGQGCFGMAGEYVIHAWLSILVRIRRPSGSYAQVSEILPEKLLRAISTSTGSSPSDCPGEVFICAIATGFSMR